MMCSKAIVILLSVAMQVTAETGLDQLVDRLVDRLAWLDSEPENLDSTMLAKPGQVAVSAGRPALLPLRTGSAPYSRMSNFALSRASSFRTQAAQVPYIYSGPISGIQAPAVSPVVEENMEEPAEPKPLTTRVVEAMSLFVSAKEVSMAALRHGIDQRAKVGALMALMAMMLLTPSYAGILSATKDLTDATNPIITSLKEDYYQTLSTMPFKELNSKVINLEEIVKGLDDSLDAFLSVPPEKFNQMVKALKAATSEAATSRSILTVQPSIEASEKVAAAAAAALAFADKAKIKKFADQAMKVFKWRSVNQVAATRLLLDGGKFAASLNPGDRAKASAAALEVIQASSG